MFFELIILIILLAILLDYLIKKERNDLTANIPGPTNYPIFGGALGMMERKPHNVLEYSLKGRAQYGGLYKVFIFNKLFIFGSDPKDLEIIMSSPKYINKSTMYDLLHKWLGTGLLLSSGAKWHSRRKIITPTFHFKILEQFCEIFEQQSQILVNKLQPKAKTGEEFNIQPFICLAALDIITETAMGTKVHAQTDSENEYVRAIADILDIMGTRFVDVWLRFDFFFTIFASDMKNRQTKAIKTLHNYTESVIESRRKALEESISNATFKPFTDEDIGSKKRMALLDVLLQSTVNGKQLTNEDIREEVDTFMFEGHDTTTSAICSALFLLSRHPQVQTKAFEEIKEVLGDDKSKTVGYRELMDLKYLECVIKETLRLYPPVPMYGRSIQENVTLTNGAVIPAGSNFGIFAFTMQRDEIMFPNPNEFIPERHTPENSTEKSNPFAYIPFSAGPRNCIGQKFAMLEMKSTLSKILRYYELLPMGPDMKLTVNLVLRSGNGVQLGLKERIY